HVRAGRVRADHDGGLLRALVVPLDDAGGGDVVEADVLGVSRRLGGRAQQVRGADEDGERRAGHGDVLVEHVPDVRPVVHLDADARLAALHHLDVRPGDVGEVAPGLRADLQGVAAAADGRVGDGDVVT